MNQMPEVHAMKRKMVWREWPQAGESLLKDGRSPEPAFVSTWRVLFPNALNIILTILWVALYASSFAAASGKGADRSEKLVTLNYVRADMVPVLRGLAREMGMNIVVEPGIVNKRTWSRNAAVTTWRYGLGSDAARLRALFRPGSSV